jgi:hypothetical protein
MCFVCCSNERHTDEVEGITNATAGEETIDRCQTESPRRKAVRADEGTTRSADTTHRQAMKMTTRRGEERRRRDVGDLR